MDKTEFKNTVRSFFRDSFWKPKSGNYVNYVDLTCCPITACLLNFNLVDEKTEINYHIAANKLQLPTNFVIGVTHGFDGAFSMVDIDQYREGFKMGRELRSELLFNGDA